MGCLYVLYFPFHATLLHEHVLQEGRQSLILHASNKRKLACELSLLPGRRGSGRIERVQGGWSKETRQTVGFTLIKVVEQNVSGAFNTALSKGGLHTMCISQYSDA